jgi:hypothetical protein
MANESEAIECRLLGKEKNMKPTFQEQRDDLIAHINTLREARNNKRVSIQDFDLATVTSDGIDCAETVLVVYIVDLIIRKLLCANDFSWAERHLPLLEHITRCESCLMLTLIEEDDPQISGLTEVATERLKCDQRLPEVMRDQILLAFGGPKGLGGFN